MPVTWVRTVILAAVIVAVSGCSKSNPLIGKWKLAPNGGPECAALDGVEFAETTMTMEVMGKQTATVTYSRDGDHYLVAAPSGTITFEKNSDGIKAVSPFSCQLLPAS
jgi:hypothetical protein